jgi:glycerophosphoryl diester phosphodiesterase
LADRFREILRGRPVILGHRGSPEQAQENSLESFRLALAAGADGVELDVHGTADGELIVFHDETLADGLFIRKHTLAEVREAARRRRLVVHTLDEVFRELAGKGFINIELKHEHIEAQVLKFARDLLPPDTFLWSSFSPEVVAACRKLAPDIPAILIYVDALDLAPVIDTVREIDASGIAFFHSYITVSLAEFFREQDVPLFTWTVNDLDEAKRMESLGVAGIITDRPRELMKHFSKK